MVNRVERSLSERLAAARERISSAASTMADAATDSLTDALHTRLERLVDHVAHKYANTDGTPVANISSSDDLGPEDEAVEADAYELPRR